MSAPSTLHRWEGTFKTTSVVYLTVGTVEGKLGVPLADNTEEYNTICEFEYTGTYRNAQKLIGSVYVRKERMSVTIPPSQNILFTITHRSTDTIEGSYACITPHDAGVFTLKRV